MSDDIGYGLILAFDREGDDDVPFALGFECGRLWEALKTTPEPFTWTMHTENSEMVIRMCEAVGRGYSAEILEGETHVDVTFEAAR